MFRLTVFASFQAGRIRTLLAFFNLTTFRVDTPSFVAGVLVTTLAFFVAFSELIKLFFSIVINHSSNLDCGSTMTGKKGLSFDGPFECEFRGVKQA